ncbi:hypothetical protein LOK49_LG08G02696 [Camellia lanceoleosa]|uniref:Uncharacterized protein n=1 Tax=Camellia lanceoleosa TaxID=1840588 RepID=A0ACC0GU06_9ERIC|nr:hypothetical protein LOK49_LG08G02696 [Camellia lanceoleosa]
MDDTSTTSSCKKGKPRRFWNHREELFLITTMKDVTRVLDAKGMRNRPFPFYEDWLIPFENDRATGELAEDLVDAVATMEKEDANATTKKGEQSPVEQFNMNMGDTDYLMSIAAGLGMYGMSAFIQLWGSSWLSPRNLDVVVLTTTSLADHHKPPEHEHKPPGNPGHKPPTAEVEDGKKPPKGPKPPPKHKPPTPLDIEVEDGKKPPKGPKPPPKHKPPTPEEFEVEDGKKPPKGPKPPPKHKPPTPEEFEVADGKKPPKGPKPPPKHKPPTPEEFEVEYGKKPPKGPKPPPKHKPPTA